MTFLPPNFEIPTKSDQFMKLETGNNKFRILSGIYEGHLFFTEDNRPKRKRINRDANGEIPKDAKFSLMEMIELKAAKSKNKDSITGFEEQRYFWMFFVYNQVAKRFQVLEITQKGLLKEMLAKMKKEDWQDPTTYDFEICKSGSGMTGTNYILDTCLPKPLPKQVLDELETLQYSIEAIFEGGYAME